MWINPYSGKFSEDIKQVRSNFHTHAGRIDGCSVNTIEDTKALYEKLGYGLLSISNHNKFTPMQDKNTPDAQLKFLDGYEHTCAQHLLCLGINREYDTSTPYQSVIDDVNAKGGITVLCHPNWIREEFWEDAELLSLTGYCGMEIINGVISRLEGTGLATKEWDMLLSSRKRVWGFGTDDYHLQSDASRAWTMIFSPSNDPAECMAALKDGAFYASTGMRLESLEINDGKLCCKAVRMVKTHLKNYTYRFYGKGGILLKEEFTDTACCELGETDGYVRVQVINEDGGMLWTQPVYTEGWFK